MTCRVATIDRTLAICSGDQLSLDRTAANPGGAHLAIYVSSTGTVSEQSLSAQARPAERSLIFRDADCRRFAVKEIRMPQTLNIRESSNAPQRVLLGGALVVLVWSYWPTLATLAHRWSIDPQYSHGFIVPLVAAALIWLRRDKLSRGELLPSWLGLPLIAAAVGMRLAASRFYFEALDWLSLLPSVAGVCLLLGGRTAWRCAWPGILFLSFMVPLPYRIETLLGGPLQSIATLASTFTLQTLGFPAIAEGNLIRIDETTIGVAETCSGLRMLVVFFAVSTAVAILIDQTVWERGLIVVSAVPIAMLCNVVRITATGILFETVGSTWAKLVFHDFAGWLMMILALVTLRIELWLLAHILVAPPPRDVIPVFNQRTLEAAPPGRASSFPAVESRTIAAQTTADSEIEVEETAETVTAV
ncbi:exosortase [bacterium]|nr:exosortase [bacterium]